MAEPKAAPLAPVLQRQSAYDLWEQKQGIPIVTGFYIADVNDIEVKPLDLMRVPGAIVDLEGCGGTNSAYAIEIPAGGATTPIRHMIEILCYVTKGRGATTVWYGENEKHSFEWQTGSVFSVPLNARYQHFNGSGTDPTRIFVVTTAPTVMNLFHNEEFIFNNPFVFTDRMDNPKHFSGDGTLYTGHTGRVRVWETNFIPDVRTHDVYSWRERGAGGGSLMFELAHNTMCAHISQFPIGTYKKGHRHGPGAHVVILGGDGFSMLWPRGKPEERVKVDWKIGSVVVPPTQWFHQHFNTGNNYARYLALRWGSARYGGMALGANENEAADVSESEGGAQIEYENEDRTIHQIFEDDLKKHGAECNMKQFTPWCTGK